MMLLALLVPIILTAIAFGGLFAWTAFNRGCKPKAEALALGAVTNFFDTLGIGSFAPTMAWFKFRRMVEDRLIPCTMLVGHTPPAMLQGIIFLMLLGVMVDPILLTGCIIALTMGGLLGAPIAARSKVWAVQLIMAVALMIAAALYALTNLSLMPGGGAATSLPVELMIIAIAANFVFGALLNFGIGNYAPTLVMLSLMGMDPRLCFPIMAGGASLAAVGASVRHINYGEVDLRVAGGLALGGIPAVLVAVFIVKSMPITVLRWLVVVVVLYAALIMLREAFRGRRRPISSLEERAEAL
jgi:hypothetical protein